MDKAGGTDNVGIPEHVVSTATSGAYADIHGVDFPDGPAVAGAGPTAARHIDEPTRLRHARVMKWKAIGRRNRALGSPLTSDFTGYRVEPPAPLRSVINVHHVILILHRPQGGHESIVVSADRDRMP